MKKDFVIKFILIAIVATNISAYAQKSNVGAWYVYYGNQKISKKLNWHNEVQYRNYDFLGDTQQLLLRTGLGYNLTENNNNILLGYGFIHSEKYLADGINKIDDTEHRIYQQFITKQNFGVVNIQHRYRLEERFLANDFKLRFRYFLSLNIPLNSKIMEKNTVYASAYNEVFLNSQSSIFDRNRLYGGLGYIINKNFKIEGGLMSQMVDKSHRNQFQVMIFNNLPLTNK